MPKKYLNKNVLEAAQERIEFLFESFEKVCVAFSGGKDSTVCLNLVLDYAREHDCLDRVAVYHLDYEAQYRMTTDFVTETFASLPDRVEGFWLCLPIKAQSCCSMTQDFWIPWEKEKQALWVRKMPDSPYLITEDSCPFDCHGWDYDAQEKFCRWYAQENGKTAFVIGIRADESLRRRCIVGEDSRGQKVDSQNWINKAGICCNAYPIYDWTTQDDWVYFAQTGHSYNKLYDLFYQAGMTIDQMRVASPFNAAANATLKYYKAIDPDMWGLMISRVNGVGFVGRYGDTKAMAWQKIEKPAGMTWQQYANFLLNTLDPEVREHYLAKLETSKKFWKETGAGLKDESVQYLKNKGIPFTDHGPVSNRTKKNVITIPDYMDDADVKTFAELPTYKRLCICIMKNDLACKYMGFGLTKKDYERRKKAIEKYANL